MVQAYPRPAPHIQPAMTTISSNASVRSLDAIPRPPPLLQRYRLTRRAHIFLTAETEVIHGLCWRSQSHMRLRPHVQLLLRMLGLSAEMMALACAIYLGLSCKWGYVFYVTTAAAAIPCTFWEFISLSSHQIPRIKVSMLATYEIAVLLLVQTFACGRCAVQVLDPTLADAHLVSYRACRPFLVAYSVCILISVVVRVVCSFWSCRLLLLMGRQRQRHYV
ncbi:hypothetical protein BROUX41_005861 [Berkeleyomyces rouxiae]|uniref:uncharacterized protein n=1 Tax=Berkeleyomyces rouxiae TaxID=2035830 RepID=UPI003B79D2D8